MSTTKQKLDELKRHREVLEEGLRVGYLESLAREQRWLGESTHGDLVDRNEALYDGIGMSRFQELDAASAPLSLATDRANGDNYPIWRTENEHAQIRGICRVLATIDEVAIAAMENLVNYSIGPGLSYTVQPRSKTPTDSDRRLCEIVQDAVERFVDRNKLKQERDREEFLRLHRDGESGVVLVQDSSGIPRARLVDPSFITEPDRPRALEDQLAWKGEPLSWKYGLATSHSDTTEPRFMFVSWYGDALECDVFAESRFVWCKVNIDSEVKRGLSGLFPVWRNLLNAGKLLNNTVQGSAIQAAIAYIREHAAGTSNDQIEDFVSMSGSAARARKTDGTQRTVYERRTKPGMIVDVPNGAKFQAGPLGTQREPAYIEVVQAALRLVGVRFQQPEYMISGDASNGTFSSTLVAEAPFTKGSEARQGLFVSHREELAWKAVRLMCVSGVIPARFADVRRVCSLRVEGPEIAVRDKLEAHQIRREEYEGGVRSQQTWAEDAGLEWEEEQRRGLSQSQVAADPAAAAIEPAAAALDAEPETVADAEQKSAQVADAAKIAYPVISIVGQVGKGEISRDAGIAQLMTLFGFSQSQAEGLVGQPQTPAPTGQTVAEAIANAWKVYP